MSTIERAIQIAAAAHAGQSDKGGEPYILHPLRVMLRMSTEEERIAAVLHDVVEDSEYTFELLSEEGFSVNVISALEALTKRPGETRIEAAHRAAGHPLARRVKLADNAENSDLSRIPNPTEKDHERLDQYRLVRKILEAASAA
ncbi:MAG: HD domain-containing protein [Proteobacteria bacterium]|nr:HD domain-containing protein [Pseudomonadota bacterium]